MEISIRKLWKAKYENVLRLAAWLQLPTTDCDCLRCKIIIINLVARKINE